MAQVLNGGKIKIKFIIIINGFLFQQRQKSV